MRIIYLIFAAVSVHQALYGASIALPQISNEVMHPSDSAFGTLITIRDDFGFSAPLLSEEARSEFNALSNANANALADAHHARMLAEIFANLERHAQELQDDPAPWLGDPNPEGSIESFDSGLFRQWARNDPSAALEWVNSSTTVVPEPKSYALIVAAISFGAVFFSRRTLVNRQ